MPTLGPGSLSIGSAGAQIDVSCLVNGARITTEKDQADATTKLCGTKRPGAVTYTASLTGNVDVDSDTGDGLFALSWADPGSQHPFEFIPSAAAGTKAAGIVVVDPLDFGADAFGDDMTSDFEFAIVGDVTYTYPDGSTRVFRTGIPVRQPAVPPDTAAATVVRATAPAAAVDAG